MFQDLLSLLQPSNKYYQALLESLPLLNAVVESALLHLRQLVDILLSRDKREEDAIRLKDLLPNFQDSRLEELREKYGRRDNKGSPCWTLNKMLAHPTYERSDRYDYSSLLQEMAPLVKDLIAAVRPGILAHSRLNTAVANSPIQSVTTTSSSSGIITAGIW